MTGSCSLMHGVEKDPETHQEKTAPLAMCTGSARSECAAMA